MTKREAEELIEIEIDGTEKQECTEERYVLSLLFGELRLQVVYLFSLIGFRFVAEHTKFGYSDLLLGIL